MKQLFPLVLLFTFTSLFSQRPGGQSGNPITISGTVLDNDSGQPLEYATLVLESVEDPSKITGGITDIEGKFSVETNPGNFNIRVEYISFKSYTLPNQNLTASRDLGTIRLSADVEQLEGV